MPQQRKPIVTTFLRIDKNVINELVGWLDLNGIKEYNIFYENTYLKIKEYEKVPFTVRIEWYDISNPLVALTTLTDFFQASVELEIFYDMYLRYKSNINKFFTEAIATTVDQVLKEDPDFKDRYISALKKSSTEVYKVMQDFANNDYKYKNLVSAVRLTIEEKIVSYLDILCRKSDGDFILYKFDITDGKCNMRAVCYGNTDFK